MEQEFREHLDRIATALATIAACVSLEGHHKGELTTAQLQRLLEGVGLAELVREE